MSALQRLMAPLQRRVMLMVGRAIVELADDSTKLQALQVTLLAGEVRGDVERFQNYGFTSTPLPGAEAVAVSVAGNRDHVVVVAVDDRRYRKLGLRPGEVAVYTRWGDCIVLREGEIELQHATKVRITSPLVEATGELQVAGNITSGGDITAAGNVADQGGAKTMAGMRGTYNGHHHATSPAPDAAM